MTQLDLIGPQNDYEALLLSADAHLKHAQQLLASRHKVECWDDSLTPIPVLLERYQGAALRDAGTAATLSAQSPEWIDDALLRLVAYARDRAFPEFLAEDFRYFWERTGRPAPTSHHAWGALFQLAAKRGLIRPTGRYEKAKSRRTHAHPVAVWRAT